ncbi:general transcription factor 3C polypeptide 6 isoform X4 [Brachionichthys hirsutus]|uniref:general transcription factor 3C polypeptide 6 isoform X4 n=1 Tax=Brachionichthys hirsutus TaxID=412623 RepID=UPI0036053691
MEDEWEEEEQLVVVELSGVINSDCLSKCPGACTILDIDSEKPMMQIGQYVFAGEYEETLGTCVLFEEGPNKGHSGTGPDLKYTCHTGKKLMMQRIFLTEKKEGETSRGSGDTDEQKTKTCVSSEEDSNRQDGSTFGVETTEVKDTDPAVL